MKYLQLLLDEWQERKSDILLQKPVTSDQIQEVRTLADCITGLELALLKEQQCNQNHSTMQSSI